MNNPTYYEKDDLTEQDYKEWLEWQNQNLETDQR